MEDLTVIFLTVNKVPLKWAEYQKQVLLEAIGDTPIITISREPLNWGKNVIQKEPISDSNVYWQLLRGAKMATTPYIAVAEDDVLYSKEHFTCYRPAMDTFAYNMTRWSICTWGRPTYWYGGRISNSMLIAPTRLAIEALEERFNKYPDGLPLGKVGELGRPAVEKCLHVSQRKMVVFWTPVPDILFHHDYELDKVAVKHKKKMSTIRAYDIPYWGKAEELVKHFK